MLVYGSRVSYTLHRDTNDNRELNGTTHGLSGSLLHISVGGASMPPEQ